MHQPSWALAVATLLIITLGSTNTFAADAKNYPGSTCQPASDNSAASLRTSLGVVSNSSSTDSIALECPIIKDVLNTPVSRGRIAVVAQNPSQGVGCVVRSVEAVNGADFPSRIFSQIVRTTATAPGVQYLDFESLPNFGNDSYYLITCALPPRFLDNEVPRESGIVFYQVREVE